MKVRIVLITPILRFNALSNMSSFSEYLENFNIPTILAKRNNLNKDSLLLIMLKTGRMDKKSTSPMSEKGYLFHHGRPILNLSTGEI